MKKSTLLLVAVMLLVTAVVAARLYATDDDFGLTNPAWNGLSRMMGEAGARPIYSLSGLPDAAAGHTLLVVAPTAGYTPDEAALVAGFLDRGGVVVVLDDFGTADSLLSGIGSPVTIDPVPMCQYEGYHVNRSFPVVTGISPTPYTENVSTLVLNHPAVLDVSGSGEAIASTSRYAWLDGNDNARLDADEKLGSYPVAASCAMGAGTLVVVSDPDVLINGMLGMGDNAAFLRALSRGSVLVDASHGSPVTPLGSAYYLLKYDLPAQVAALLLLMLSCAAWLAWLGTRRNAK